MDDNPDALRTLSVKEGYELYQCVYGPSPMTAFYVWRNKCRIQPAPVPHSITLVISAIRPSA